MIDIRIKNNVEDKSWHFTDWESYRKFLYMIAEENEDTHYDFDSHLDGNFYINHYCDNLDLLPSVYTFNKVLAIYEGWRIEEGDYSVFDFEDVIKSRSKTARMFATIAPTGEILRRTYSEGTLVEKEWDYGAQHLFDYSKSWERILKILRKLYNEVNVDDPEDSLWQSFSIIIHAKVLRAILEDDTYTVISKLSYLIRKLNQKKLEECT